jgi:drug/metabolite transporter (DMT)-like permease
LSITTGIIFGILAMIAWGTSDFFAKKAVDKIGPYRTFAYSYLFGMFFILFFFILFPSYTNITFKLAGILLLLGIVNFLGYFFLYKGIELEKVSIISMVASCSPLMVFFLGVFLLNEVVATAHAIGAVVSVMGLVLLSAPSKIAKVNRWAVFMGIGTMVAWGLTIFLFGYFAIATHWIFAALLYKTVTYLVGISFLKLNRVRLTKPKRDIWIILILVGVVDSIGLLLFNYGAVIGIVSLVGPISALYPSVTLLLAWAFLKERLHLWQKIGGAGILLGLVLMSV